MNHTNPRSAKIATIIYRDGSARTINYESAGREPGDNFIVFNSTNGHDVLINLTQVQSVDFSPLEVPVNEIIMPR